MTFSMERRDCLQYMAAILLIASCLLQVAESAYVPSTVTIKGNSVYINGSKFFGRGLAYGPTPIGQWPDSKAGCCTYDWYSNSAIYKRDLPLIQELNANLIRTYTWRNNMRHDAFLDECYKRGIYVIASFAWDWDLYNNNQQAMKNSLVQMVQNHADHPAIAMWIVGNELNTKNGYDPNVYNFVKTLKDLIHATEAPYWHPVGTTLADGSSLWETINARDSMNTVDVWMVQLYKGKSFYDFWSKYKAASSKPLFITEYGVSAYIAGKTLPYSETQQADWEQAQWTEMLQHTDILSGSLKFSWSDGWFKCSGASLTAHDTCSYASGAFPGGMVHEEWFGMTAFVNSNPDPNFNDPIRVKESYCRFKHEWRSFPRTQVWAPTNLSGCPAEVDSIFSVADAVVRPGTYSAINYGSDTIITLKYTADPNFYREALVRYDLSQVSSQGPWDTVNLVLTMAAIDSDVDFPVNVDLISDDSWNEMQVTFDNKPNSTPLTTATRRKGASTLVVDVTDTVNAAYVSNPNARISFRLYRADGSGEKLDFHSRQSMTGQAVFPRLELSGIRTIDTVSTSTTGRSTTTTGSRSSGSTGTTTAMMTTGSTTGVMETGHDGQLTTDSAGAGDAVPQQRSQASSLQWYSVLTFICVIASSLLKR